MKLDTVMKSISKKLEAQKFVFSEITHQLVNSPLSLFVVVLPISSIMLNVLLVCISCSARIYLSIFAHLDKMETDDAVNVYKALIRDGRIVPGAGATEIELSKRLAPLGDSAPGLDQVCYLSFYYFSEINFFSMENSMLLRNLLKL